MQRRVGRVQRLDHRSMRTYHLWAPSTCRTHFPVSVLRIAVDTSAETGIDDWREIARPFPAPLIATILIPLPNPRNYIDYVEVFGSEAL